MNKTFLIFGLLLLLSGFLNPAFGQCWGGGGGEGLTWTIGGVTYQPQSTWSSTGGVLTLNPVGESYTTNQWC